VRAAELNEHIHQIARGAFKAQSGHEPAAHGNEIIEAPGERNLRIPHWLALAFRACDWRDG
jgi:hypothetical protein